MQTPSSPAARSRRASSGSARRRPEAFPPQAMLHCLPQTRPIEVEIAARSWLARLAGEPGAPARVESVDLGPLQRRHVALDSKADPGLDVCEVAVALGKLAEELRVQAQRRAGVDRIESVLFVDRLPQNDRPDVAALCEEIVEPSGADNVAGSGVDLGALRNRHLGLRA